MVTEVVKHLRSKVDGLFECEVLSIEYIEDARHAERYKRVKEELTSEGLQFRDVILYHGTSRENAQSILRGNFDEDYAVAWEGGTWFATRPNISSGWSMVRSCDRSPYIMLANRVLLVKQRCRANPLPFRDGPELSEYMKCNHMHWSQGDIVPGGLVKVIFNTDHIWPCVKITFTD